MSTLPIDGEWDLDLVVILRLLNFWKIINDRSNKAGDRKFGFKTYPFQGDFYKEHGKMQECKKLVNTAFIQPPNARMDFLHKLTTQLVRENQTIVVEDLATPEGRRAGFENMVKNHKLALSISDASWGELVRQLVYKCEWYGRELIKIDRWFPCSKRCGNCGHIVDKLPLNIREWECPK